MNKRIKPIYFAFAVIAIALLAAVCLIAYESQFKTYHLPPTICEFMLGGVSPEAFCEREGEGTWLEDQYASAKVDKDGCLILKLSDERADEWKNSFFELQVLQSVLGESRDIGVEVKPSEDFIGYIEDAHTCGFEIAEDYTRVTASPEDNHWYYPVIMPACIEMQVFAGKDCHKIVAEYVEIDEKGEITERTTFSKDTHFAFESITEGE